MRPFYVSDKHPERELTQEQIAAVKPILDDLTPQFIQLWRELYTERTLGRYVSRISKSNHHETIERVGTDGWLEVYDAKDQSLIAKTPPPTSPSYTGLTHEPLRDPNGYFPRRDIPGDGRNRR